MTHYIDMGVFTTWQSVSTNNCPDTSSIISSNRERILDLNDIDLLNKISDELDWLNNYYSINNKNSPEEERDRRTCCKIDVAKLRCSRENKEVLITLKISLLSSMLMFALGIIIIWVVNGFRED